MYQRNRNLFSFLAVLLTASLITGMGGLFLHLADQLGGAPRLASEDANINSPTLAFPGAGASLAASDSAGVELNAESNAELNAEPMAQFDGISDNRSAVTLSSRDAQTIGTHSAAVLSVATVTTGPIVASGSYDNTVKLWNRTDATDVQLLPHESAVNDLVFSSDEAHLVTGTDAGTIQLWDLDTRQVVTTILAEAGRRINTVAIDKRSETIASGDSNGSLKVWPLAADFSAGSAPIVLSDVGPQINSLMFHPGDRNLLISANQKGAVQVWNISQNKVVATLEGSANQILSLDVSRDGRYVATGSYDQTVRVWEIKTGELLQSFKGHDAVVADVAFSPQLGLLASGSYDESIRIWDWANATLTCKLEGSAGFVYDVAFAEGGRLLASGGYDGTVEVWDLTVNDACLSL